MRLRVMFANQTDAGENVLQKGYSASGWKVQVEGRRDRGQAQLRHGRFPEICDPGLVRNAVSVADGAWHRIECRRYGTKLGIIVDADVRGIITIPATLSVSNTVLFNIRR